jgi:hypothetical protein
MRVSTFDLGARMSFSDSLYAILPGVLGKMKLFAVVAVDKVR